MDATSVAPDLKEQIITPELAQLWLDEGNVDNRKLRPRRVKYYAAAMLRGAWRLGEPLIFDSAGRILNGQHRLAAVVEAGIAVRFYVLWGVSPEAFVVMDDVLPRRVSDVATGWAKNNTRAAADARGLLISLVDLAAGNRVAPTRDAVLGSLEDHAEAIEFVLIQCGQRGDGGHSSSSSITPNSQVRVPCIRAYYHMPADLVADFIRTFRWGDPGVERYEQLRPALLLRNWFFSIRPHAGSGAIRAEVYSKTERALMAVWRQEQLSKLYPAAKELFPLPDEEYEAGKAGR